MTLRIKFLGGVKTVTGSSHLVTTDKSQVLLDAGLFHGHRDEFYAVNTTFHYNPRKLDAIILSHAHIDHCGNIPTLIKKGIRCKVYTTSATKDLTRLMLEDSGHIQEEDIRYVNKVNRRLGLPLRKPLYTKKEAIRATKVFRSLSYGERFRIARDMFVILQDAGHILGASIVALEIQNSSSSGSTRIGYAVDLGRRHLPLLNDPVIPKGLDYLIIESTYGGRLHAPIEEATAKLKKAICMTVERSGKVLIPAFSLERTQEVIYFLNELLRDKAIPSVPVYVDSPLATDITDVFKYHLAYLNEETQQRISQGHSPFEFLNLKFIRNQEESKALNNDNRPMIIIAGSGMCESGRMLHHLKNNIEDSRSTILVVGYMAKETLGRKMVEGNRIVRIFGVEYELNADVIVINAFSGHADQEGLIEFVTRCLPLKGIYLVHGDEDQSQILRDELSRRGIASYIPSRDEEVVLD